MVKKRFVILIYLFSLQTLYSQSGYKDFFEALLNNKENIKDFVDENELARSQRLGITYTGKPNKFILSNEISQQVKDEIKSGRLRYELKETLLENDFSSVEISIWDLGELTGLAGKLTYYFHKGKFIDPAMYYSRAWQTRESKYFIFKISESEYFNEYCINKLDEFVDRMADTLKLSSDERELLQKEKLYYFFCKDEKEVQTLSGYRSKGQAILAFDEVITAYQTHFHEVAHLLMNFKLKNPGLFTLPFFIEGFAVAMGGRGGMAPRVVTDIGYYLQKSGEMPYDSILTYDSFTNTDPGMTYSVAGLYNSFLINELGINQYIELYKRVNGDLSFVQNIKAPDVSLPDKSKFEDYLEKYKADTVMYVNAQDTLNIPFTIQGMNGNFKLAGNYIKFFTSPKYKISFGDVSTDPGYISRKYLEIYKDGQYSREKYCITTSDESIDIYNLFNDELIYSYNKGLSTENILIPKTNGYYNFFIKSELFGDDFNSNDIILDGTSR